MAKKKFVNKSATREELLRELNRIARVVWEEVPHEPCKYQNLPDTISRIIRQQLSSILEARALIEKLLEKPFIIDQDLRCEFEDWVLGTRMYEDDPGCNDMSRRAESVYTDWGDEECNSEEE